MDELTDFLTIKSLSILDGVSWGLERPPGLEASKQMLERSPVRNAMQRISGLPVAQVSTEQGDAVHSSSGIFYAVSSPAAQQ